MAAAPALRGALPVGLMLFALTWLPRALHLLWQAAPEEMLGAGACTIVRPPVRRTVTFQGNTDEAGATASAVQAVYQAGRCSTGCRRVC